MDVNNLGSSDLALRILFADPVAGPPNNMAFSSASILVPAGSGWLSIQFPVDGPSLTAGLGSVSTALASVTEMRIFHSVADAFPIEPIVALVGVDNIRAAATSAVSDGTSTLVLLSAGLLGMFVASGASRLRGWTRRVPG